MRAATSHAVQDSAALVPEGRWIIDPKQSRVEFTVRHLLSTLECSFGDFDGELAADDHGRVTAHGSVRVASIDSGLDKRDESVCGEGFFDAATHPEMRFESSRIEPELAGGWRISGRLTIKDVTREVVLHAQPGQQPAWGHDRMLLSVTGEVDRRDFGLVWPHSVEAIATVGHRIKLMIEVCVTRRVPAA